MKGRSGLSLSPPDPLRACSAFSRVNALFMQTGSPTTLPVPPAPARGQLASPTTQKGWLPFRGRGQGAGGWSWLPSVRPRSLPSSQSPPSRAGSPERDLAQEEGRPMIALAHEFCFEAHEGGKLTRGPPALTSPGRGWGC